MDNITDAGPIATKLTDILAKDYSAVQKRTRIYYELGMKSGADFHKLDKDAGNDAWIFFHTMLLQYFGSRTNSGDALKAIVKCLKSLDLVFCAGKVAALDLGSCPFSGEIFWHNMEDVCSNFVGRDTEFQRLEECLQTQNSTTESTILTSVSGMGGIGKTTLARKFAYHFRRVLNGSVAWLPAQNASLVTDEFNEIGDQLSITKKSSTRKFTKAIYETLLKKNANVLFIFDNLDDPINEWIQEFLPSGLVTRRPFILITSRRRDIILQLSNVIDLDVLSVDDALQMIKKVLPEISHEIGVKLAKTLQFYPLALQIALSAIGTMHSLNNNEATLKYIEDFDRNKATLLDKADTLPVDYKSTLSSSLKITLTKLQNFENGHEILSLLRVISIIYPDEIEPEVIIDILIMINTKRSIFRTFLEYFGGFEQAVPKTIGDDILEILCKHSILTVVSHTKKIYKIHRMIQYVIQQASTTEQMKNAVQTILRLVELRSIRYWLYEHAEFVMKYLKENKSIHGLESYDNQMKAIVSTYAAERERVPVEFMSSFMMKHFEEEPELYIDYIRYYSAKAYAFLTTKFQALLPLINPLIVATLLLRAVSFNSHHYFHNSTISRENLNLLQDFSVSEDDIIHKVRDSPFSDEKFIHMERKSQDDFIYLYVEKCFSEFFMNDVKMNAESKDLVAKFSELLITRKFGLIGPLTLIHATVQKDLRWWKSFNSFRIFETFQNSLFILDDFYRIELTYNELYEILFSESPLFLYAGSPEIPRTMIFGLHLCKSISLLPNGHSIILDLTKQDWANLLYGYDWLFASTSLHHSLLQEAQKFFNGVNKQFSESELRNVKLYCLLTYLEKGPLPYVLIKWFDFPVKFQDEISKLRLGIVLKQELYMDPLITIVYAKSCDYSIFNHAYRKILKSFHFSIYDDKFQSTKILESCFLLHEICSSNFTDDALLVFPLTLLFTCRPILTEKGVEKLYDLFLKSLDCTQLKEKEYVVRLKNELKQCFNILGIKMGDFESDLKYFFDEILPWHTHFRINKRAETMKSTNGIPVIIKKHKVLENIFSKLLPLME